MHVFVGNFTYVVDFMIIEDISSIIDHRLSQVVLGRPFIEISNMTHDLPKGVVRFTNKNDEVAYKMPHKIEQYNLLSDLEKEHTKSVYLRNEEDKRRRVDYNWMLGMKAEDKVLVCILFELETHNRATGITRFSQFPLLKMLYKLNHHLLPFLLGGKAYRSIDQGPTVHPPSQKNSFDAKLLLAVKDGVFVAQAAGNEGLMPKSIMSYSPWIRFVAVAIDVRRYRHNLTLENGKNAPHVWLEYFKMLKAWLQLSYLDEGKYD
ncbi:hypothetical protein Tco_0161676 [Tanacetum coccineum]